MTTSERFLARVQAEVEGCNHASTLSSFAAAKAMATMLDNWKAAVVDGTQPKDLVMDMDDLILDEIKKRLIQEVQLIDTTRKEKGEEL